MLRRIGAFLVVLAAAAAIHEWVWIPFRCNVTIGRARRALDAARGSRDPFRVHTAGLRNLEALKHCLALQPDHPELILLMGESLEATGRLAAARQIYCEGLAHNRSDGVLTLACARTQLLTGQPDEARAHFIRLGQYVGPSIAHMIPDPAMRFAVMADVSTRHKRLLALEERDLVANGDFQLATNPANPSTPHLKPTAASQWYLLQGSENETSTRPAGSSGKIEGLAVTTTARGGGIQQFLKSQTPRRVVVSATVLVASGRICVGASNGRDRTVTECSETTGKWETLQAFSESCPVRQVAIRAATSAGAEFIVANVEAHASDAFPLCGQ